MTSSRKGLAARPLARRGTRDHRWCMPPVTAADDPRLFVLDEPTGAGPAPPPAGPVARRTRRGRAPRRPGPVLLAVDGNGLAHRAFHAVGGAEAPPGEALERVLLMLARIGAAVRATACVVGFDDPARSLRRDRHPGYKAARPPKDDALVDLLDRLPGLLELLGLSVVVPDGLEADDVLGSAAALARRRGVAAALATGDQDAFALVAPTVQVYYLVTGGRMQQVSPSWLRARYGVPPEAYPAFAALRGDASDCLPGVRGIGAVTAARLLAAYADVDAALADRAGVAGLLGPWVVEALVTQRAVYELNRELMAIRDDVVLDVAACNRPLRRQAVLQVLEEHGAAELADRFLGGFAFLGRAAWRRAGSRPA
jgi:5'-3' exonuclease